MPTHKKGHDKDKYYHLAKDQGYRSRAAFKLIQINKRFDFLSKARVCVDLCAAPGGWCQVAAKLMLPGSIVLGIDLLPIKPIRNVKTLVSDITTAECRKLVTQELHGWKADVILCDGAPNIGSAYTKDAYVQNELALAALKTATDHLIEGGTFCTKVYRSQDYNALMWVFQQLFEDVQAIKPNSSRSQSAEIFIVCLKYTAPKSIDPKLLDPNHVFKEVGFSNTKVLDVLHKKYDKHDKRQRGGYDDSAGLLLRKVKTVSEFIDSTDPVRLLTDISAIEFSEECEEKYGNLPSTTEEIRLCLQDLKVLGKLDFKKLLKWRLQIIKSQQPESIEDDDKSEVTIAPTKRDRNQPLTEEEIQAEIRAKRERMAEQARKEKKKSRSELAKERRRQNLGINSNSFAVSDDVELFNLSGENIRRDDLEGVDEVNLESLDAGFYEDEEDGQKHVEDKRALIQMSQEELDDELESAYIRYINRTKKSRGSDGKNGNDRDLVTGYEKKAKLAQEPSAIVSKYAKQQEDQLNEDLEGYVKMLGSDDDGDESSDSDSEDEDSDEEEIDSDSDDNKPSNKKVKTTAKQSALVSSRDRLTKNERVDSWFSHPIFKESVVGADSNSVKANDTTSEKEDKADRRKRNRDVDNDDISPFEPQIPLSDKQKRKEKRKKETDRKLRKQMKLDANADSEFTLDFEIAPATGAEKSFHDDSGNVIDAETARIRDLIRQGMGKKAQEKVSGNDSLEIAPAEKDDEFVFGPMSRVDSRTYDSDSEDYDKRDKAMTLALGTMMLRKSRKKAYVDASYNRFAWNDPKDLPQWFIDDEMAHNRPQIPIPQGLLDQVNGKAQSLGNKDIKKVAEARMRKRKKAMAKLKSARKQANALAENSEMSEKQKLQAIQKAMKSTKTAKPSKVYVVTKRSKSGSMGTSSGGKGKLKFVDKVMKKEKRAERARTRRKKR